MDKRYSAMTVRLGVTDTVADITAVPPATPSGAVAAPTGSAGRVMPPDAEAAMDAAVRFDVVGDSRLLSSATVQPGVTGSMKVDVNNIMKLELVTTSVKPATENTQCGSGANHFAVWGAGQLQ